METAVEIDDAEFEKMAKERGFGRIIPDFGHFRTLAPFVDTVIDVGIAQGTPELYTSMPGKRFLLVEPNPEGEAMLQDAPQNYSMITTGLASEVGELEWHSSGASGALSSFVERTALTAAEVKETVSVPVTTLDNLIAEQCSPTERIGVKVDTEGFELEVIRGLNERADQVHFVVAEVTIRRRFVDGYWCSELIGALAERGFEFYNFMGRAMHGPRFYDMVFIRKDNELFHKMD